MERQKKQKATPASIILSLISRSQIRVACLANGPCLSFEYSNVALIYFIGEFTAYNDHL